MLAKPRDAAIVIVQVPIVARQDRASLRCDEQQTAVRSIVFSGTVQEGLVCTLEIWRPSRVLARD